MGRSAVRLARLILAPSFVCLAAGSPIFVANEGVAAVMNRLRAVIEFEKRYQQV
jgi:hypothetical protein